MARQVANRKIEAKSQTAVPEDRLRLFGMREVADRLGLSHETIRRYCREGRIRSIHLGDRRLVSADELASIVANGIPPVNQNASMTAA